MLDPYANEFSPPTTPSSSSSSSTTAPTSSNVPSSSSSSSHPSPPQTPSSVSAISSTPASTTTDPSKANRNNANTPSSSNQKPTNGTPKSVTPTKQSSLTNVDVSYRITNDDFFSYLLGCWKRNLEWREFGGCFSHLSTTNSLVLIEKFRGNDNNLSQTPKENYAKWSFGKSLDRSDLQFGYQMKFVHTPHTETYLEWQFAGNTCHGKYLPGTGVAVLNFFLPKSTVVATYHIVDQNTMAVCLCEVDGRYKPSIQYGNMYRLDPSLYHQ